MTQLNKPIFWLLSRRDVHEDEQSLVKMLGEVYDKYPNITNHSRNHDMCYNHAAPLCEMKEVMILLIARIEVLEKKIRDYEKQTLPVAEAVEVDDDEPVKYEPLFPILDPTK